jgi:hypothetical protein
MLSRSLALFAVATWAALGVGGGAAAAQGAQRISGPHVHANLAVYLIHGADASGSDKVPLTLAEALSKGSVQVTETGRVNELRVENTGGEEVFIQAGDIVKGGRQDRVLVVSLLLPPRSGAVPISSFCVEPGRWSARGGEDPTRFASASETMPSRRALLVLASPPPARAADARAPDARPANARAENEQRRGGDDTANRQREVWDSVAKTQSNLAAGLGAPVTATQSATSLQLSLEHAVLKEAQAPFLAALEAPGLEDGDVIGYVAAINGRPVSANVYPSHGLFRKVWPKQLAAVVTEAIGDPAGASPPPAPTTGAVEAFLAAPERGTPQERKTAADMSQETREGDGALYTEARSSSGRWVHKNYLAR